MKKKLVYLLTCLSLPLACLLILLSMLARASAAPPTAASLPIRLDYGVVETSSLAAPDATVKDVSAPTAAKAAPPAPKSSTALNPASASQQGPDQSSKPTPQPTPLHSTPTPPADPKRESEHRHLELSGLSSIAPGERLYVRSSTPITITFWSDPGTAYNNIVGLHLPDTITFGICRGGNVPPPTQIGPFPEGTELTFFLNSQASDAPPGVAPIYYDGPASRNPDNRIHADVSYDPEPRRTVLGWEDMWNLGDQDFDDCVMTLSGDIGVLDPYSAPDSDGDGLQDYDEINGWNNALGSFVTDPHRADSDSDGLNDGIEKRGNTNPKDADTDDDDLTDGVEDANHNGIVEWYESDPKLWDSDGDGIRDGDDPVHVKLDNRKALVIWLTEYASYVFANDLPEPTELSNLARMFEILGFEVTSHIDKRGDNQRFTYGQIKQWINEFADGLDNDDVAVVYISTHGMNVGAYYYIVYGNGFYPEDRKGDPLLNRTLTNQLNQIGPGLDFLWLGTCRSWNFEDDVDKLGAEGIIFFGAKDDTPVHRPEKVFYEAIAGATASSSSWIDYYDSSKAQPIVEDVIDDLKKVNDWEILDYRAGDMDLRDWHLSPGAFSSIGNAVVSQLEGTLILTPTLSLTGTYYLPYDSNADGLDDAVEIGWVADTTLPHEEAIAEVQVYNEAGELQQLYLVGPYTVTSGALQTVTVDYLSPVSATYEAAIELYSLPRVLAGVSRSDEIGLRAGPGSADGDEVFMSTALNHGDVLTVSFSISTTAVTETVAVVGMLATDRQSLDSVTSTVRSPDYVVASGTPVTGSLSFTPPMTGVYYINLYLVDQNNYVEDITQIHPWSTGVYTESVSDTNGNGLYDQLVIEVGLLSPQAGDYVLSGRLYDTNGNHIADAMTSGYLPEVGASLPIMFAGTAIRQSRLDGPYELRDLAFRSANDAAIDFLPVAYETGAYSFTDFEIGSALLNESYQDYLVDNDGDGYAELLDIDVGLTCAVPNTYTLEASLYDMSGIEIGHLVTSTLLATGQSTTTLAFNGRLIRSNGVDGPYTLGDLMLRDAEGEIVDQRDSAYQTAAYSATQFLAPGAVLAGSYTDYGLDTDGDGLYNYLAIDVNLDVTEAGIYQFDGMIVGTVPYTFPWASDRRILSTGVQTVTLRFDGKAIRDSQVEGRFSLAHIGVFEGSSGLLLDSGNSVYTTTHVYTYTQFQHDPIAVTGAITDAGLDTDADGLYDWLNVTLNLDVTLSSTYHVEANLVSTDDQQITDLSQLANLVTGTNALVLPFDGAHIEYAGINGPYRVEDFFVYSLDAPAFRLFVGELYTTTTAYSASQFVPDTIPPTSTVNAMNPVTNSLGLAVSWEGVDPRPGLGVESYDIQYMDTISPSVWTDWLTHTQSLAAQFGPDTPESVEGYHTYCFRSRARDRAGNLEDYPAGNGDTCVTVETERYLDMLVIKWRDSGVPVAGTNITYAIYYKNEGTIPAPNVILTDTLPEATSFVTSTRWGGEPVVPLAATDEYVTWDFDTMDPGEQDWLKVTIHVSDEVPVGTVITNTAEIATSEEETDYDNNLNTEILTTVGPDPDLTVTKYFREGAFIPGGEVSYGIYYYNEGGAPVTNVLITDTLPVATTFITSTQWGFPITPITVTDEYVIWDVGTVEPLAYQGEICVYMQISDTGAAGTILTNTVEVRGDQEESDYTDNVSTHAADIETPSRDLSVYKWLEEGVPVAGQLITYTVYVGNEGNFPASNVVVTDTLPLPISYVSDYNYYGFTTVITGNTVAWTKDSLSGNSSAWLYLIGYISDTVPMGTVLTNTVQVSTSDEETDYSDNLYIHTLTTIDPRADMRVYKNARGGAPPGGSFTYELVYQNAGGSPAANVVLTDTLPEGTVYLSCLDCLTPTVEGNQLVWDLETVPPSQWYYWLGAVTVEVSETVAPGTVLTNVIEVSTTSEESDYTNNAYNLAITVPEPFSKTASILVVLDYGGYDTGWFASYYTGALDALGCPYDVWDTGLRSEIDSTTLNQYADGVVVWAVPEWGYVTDSGWSSQTNLQSYLDHGGRLFISGQDIGYYSGGSTLFSDYLHATFVQDDTDLYGLNGISGDPISDGLYLAISGGDGANNQYYPSEIDPIAPAVSIFTYDPSATMALGKPTLTEEARAKPERGFEEPYLKRARISEKPTEGAKLRGIVSSGTGAIRVDTGTYKAVYFAFGFEAINSAADRQLVMERVLDWTWSLPGDLDFNCVVNVADIMKVANRWRMVDMDPDWNPRYDLNGDGIITVVDIMLVVKHWGETCW